MMQRKRDLERATAEHERYIDPDAPTRDGQTIVHMRAEDRSILMRGAYLAQKYFILWAPVAWLVTALGFGYVTPQQKADELKTQITVKVDSSTIVLQRQIDSLRRYQASLTATHESLEHDLGVLLRLGCMDPMVSARDKRLAGLTNQAGECIR